MTTSTSQISYAWEITGIGTLPDPQLGLVVTDLYWAYEGRLQIQSDSPECWLQVFSGAVKVSEPNPQSFTQFNQLTKAEVVAWVQDKLGQVSIDSMTADIVKSIQSQQHAYLANIEWQGLPWQQ